MNFPAPIHVLNKRLALYQAKGGFQSGLDAVLLAAACPAQSNQTLLDLGCGVGTAGLCVLVRVPEINLTGIDIQADHVALAAKNATENSITTANFICANVQDFILHNDGKNILFDHIICNPPYNDAGAHHPSPSEAKALAMGHAETSLQDWIDCANRNLKSGGSFTIIHKADQIDKIILAMDGRFGTLEIIPLWPHAGKPAKRVILRARKDRKTPATLHAGLVLHLKNGDYTPEAEEILRHMHAL
jgi:tRNA1(Val) A37 N6-methylase TrmN6